MDGLTAQPAIGMKVADSLVMAVLQRAQHYVAPLVLLWTQWETFLLLIQATGVFASCQQVASFPLSLAMAGVQTLDSIVAVETTALLLVPAYPICGP